MHIYFPIHIRFNHVWLYYIRTMFYFCFVCKYFTSTKKKKQAKHFINSIYLLFFSLPLFFLVHRPILWMLTVAINRHWVLPRHRLFTSWLYPCYAVKLSMFGMLLSMPWEWLTMTLWSKWILNFRFFFFDFFLSQVRPSRSMSPKAMVVHFKVRGLNENGFGITLNHFWTPSRII